MSNNTVMSAGFSVVIDPHEAAQVAQLHYVSDTIPGITRVRHGKGFIYRAPDGRCITDQAERQRLDALKIPPAWHAVWICPDPNGHLLAIGRDQKGRKQYLYHPGWRAVRDATKFHRMILFGERLPPLRQRLAADLRKPGLPREKVLAAAIEVMERTLIRIGNEEYTRKNETFGLTTLRHEHVKIEGQQVRFEFRGKSGKEHSIALSDERLVQIIKAIQELPGYELFQYLDANGRQRDVGSGDVNAYLHEVTGEAFSAKDFRTWGGTVLGLQSLVELADAGMQRKTPRAAQIVAIVAAALGNTKAVYKKYYIHPAVLQCCDDDKLYAMARQAMDGAEASDSAYGLTRAEAATLTFLCSVHNLPERFNQVVISVLPDHY